MSRIGSELAEHLAVANGYPSLVSRLKRSNAVQGIATRSSDSICRSLKNSIKNENSGFDIQVMPYAYLVALYLKQDRKSLEKALKLESPKAFPWFNDTVSFLLERLSISNSYHAASINALTSTKKSAATNIGVSRVTIP